MRLLIKPAPPRLVQLPEDVLAVVLNNLRRDRDVAAARGVCKTWRRVIDYSPTLWRNITFALPKRMPGTAETWYRKAAECGNAQAGVSCLDFPFSVVY